MRNVCFTKTAKKVIETSNRNSKTKHTSWWTAEIKELVTKKYICGKEVPTEDYEKRIVERNW